jgi:membrane fusion protein (multidrug efflux system)
MKRLSKRFLVIGLIGAITLTAWVISYYRQDTVAKPANSSGEPPRGMPVEATQVRVGTVAQEVSAVGTLQANESVMIRSEIPGRVSAIHFSEGQYVAEGSLLLSIDAAEYMAQVEQISATLELNELNFERAKRLYEEKLMSQQAYDELATRVKESRANLTLAKARLDKTKIRAPFSGRVGLRQVSPGDYLQPGQNIVNLEDLDPVKVDFRIPETYLGQVKTSQMVHIRVDAYPDKAFTGKIYAIDPRIDETSRTILLRARISNQDGSLRPGMFARVSVVLREHAGAVLIPEEAIVPMGEARFVFRIVEGKAALTRVETGLRLEGEVEIVKGLGPGDVVVTGGQIKLQDGIPVMVLPAGKGPRDAERKES